MYNLVLIYGTVLTERMLCDLAHHIGREWRSLGIYLGLDNVHLEHLVVEHPCHLPDRSFTMLTRWHQRHAVASGRSLEALVDALRKAERGDLADRVGSGW